MRTEISPLRLVDWMELSRSKYYEESLRQSLRTQRPFLVIIGSSSGKRMPSSTSTISSRWRAIAG
jgi:hypothetical protein